MPKFPLEPDIVMLAAVNDMVHLTISIQSISLQDSLKKAQQLEDLLSEMVSLGLIIKPKHEVR